MCGYASSKKAVLPLPPEISTSSQCIYISCFPMRLNQTRRTEPCHWPRPRELEVNSVVKGQPLIVDPMTLKVAPLS